MGKRVEVVSVQRLKPAFTADDEAPVEPPRRGRPRRQPPPVPPDPPRRRGRPPRQPPPASIPFNFYYYVKGTKSFSLYPLSFFLYSPVNED